MHVIQEGYFDGGLYPQWGRIFFFDGSVYEGYLQDGKLDGEGKYIDKNGGV